MTKREDLLDSLLAAGGEGLLLLSPAAQVLAVNRRLAEELGRTPAELEGVEAAAAGLPAALVGEAARVAASGVPAAASVPLAGRPVRLEPVRDRGGVVWGVAVLAAGTEDLAAQLAAARSEVERVRGATVRFLSAANHDLRQPFQAMQLFQHLLLHRLSDPGTRELAERMGEALEGAEGLLRALVEVARLDAGIDRPQPAAVPLDGVFGRLLREFEGPAGTRGLRLVVRPCAATVRSDTGHLERLLRQLLSNAVRFTDRGGVLLAARRRGRVLCIEVWDSGPGIHPDDVSRLFDDFHKAHGAAGKKGAGFGLAIARRLADGLGHALAVRSRPGRGSVFSLTVPLA
ncbi:sensor histidine kinase, partial [Azospirillum halopraeferens]|uniref:sensor histidine kinase n=1 Tax=Azospirillum halopraeferens TaxID=34010 RepID=UPI000425B7ED